MPREHTPLTATELQTFLRDHPGWSLVEGMLERMMEFPTFLAGIAFVHQVAEVAEKHDHHPDIDIRYRTITLRLMTHDAKALTFKDLLVAGECDRLLE